MKISALPLGCDFLVRTSLSVKTISFSSLNPVSKIPWTSTFVCERKKLRQTEAVYYLAFFEVILAENILIHTFAIGPRHISSTPETSLCFCLLFWWSWRSFTPFVKHLRNSSTEIRLKSGKAGCRSVWWSQKSHLLCFWNEMLVQGAIAHKHASVRIKQGGLKWTCLLACDCSWSLRFPWGSEFAIIQTKNRSVCEDAMTGIRGNCRLLVIGSW